MTDENTEPVELEANGVSGWAAKKLSIPLMVLLLFVLLAITAGRPVLGSIAIKMEDGGILAAIGKWDVPASPLLTVLHPIGFLIITIMAAGIAYTSDRESVRTMVAITYILLFATGILMVARYHVWHLT